MASFFCNKSLSDFLSGVVIPTGAASIFTYNGFVVAFDGNVNNIAQFVVVPASPPGEFPAPAGNSANISFNTEGHTPGYYSWSFTITDPTHGPFTTNFVVPIIAGPDQGQNAAEGFYTTDAAFNILAAWGSNAPSVPTGKWYNQAEVNAFTGYSTNGTSFINDDTFTPSTGVGIFPFKYRSKSQLAGYTEGCDECDQTSTLYIKVSTNCAHNLNCFSGAIPPAEEVHSIVLLDGTVLNNINYPTIFTFPYDTDLILSAAQFEEDCQDWFDDNGGGTVTVNWGPLTGFTYNFANICQGIEKICLDVNCVTFNTPTKTLCL